MAVNPEVKFKVKLPKVVNSVTGHESLAPFQFSFANWADDTAAYKKAIDGHGVVFICQVLTAAHHMKKAKNTLHSHNVASTDAPGSNEAINPCAQLCNCHGPFLKMYSVLMMAGFQDCQTQYPTVPLPMTCMPSVYTPGLYPLLCCRLVISF